MCAFFCYVDINDTSLQDMCLATNVTVVTEHTRIKQGQFVRCFDHESLLQLQK